MKLRAIWTVFQFECGRTLNLPHLAVLLTLAAFPVSLLALIQYQGGELERDMRGGFMLFVLVPELTCVMSLLLAAAPVVQAELEGKTWTYLAVSPAGKDSVLLGKYLTATVWTVLTAWLSLALSMPVVWPQAEPLRLWGTLALLIPLSSAAYGALYVFLGVVFLKRALLAAVAYTIVSEVLVGFIPAVINHFTVQFHLRSLLMKWMEWEAFSSRMRLSSQFFSEAPAWQHLLMLLVFTVTFLILAIVLLKRRELVLADQN